MEREGNWYGKKRYTSKACSVYVEQDMEVVSIPNELRFGDGGEGSEGSPVTA